MTLKKLSSDTKDANAIGYFPFMTDFHNLKNMFILYDILLPVTKVENLLQKRDLSISECLNLIPYIKKELASYSIENESSKLLKFLKELKGNEFFYEGQEISIPNECYLEVYEEYIEKCLDLLDRRLGHLCEFKFLDFLNFVNLYSIPSGFIENFQNENVLAASNFYFNKMGFYIPENELIFEWKKYNFF